MVLFCERKREKSRNKHGTTSKEGFAGPKGRGYRGIFIFAERKKEPPDEAMGGREPGGKRKTKNTVGTGKEGRTSASSLSVQKNLPKNNSREGEVHFNHFLKGRKSAPGRGASENHSAKKSKITRNGENGGESEGSLTPKVGRKMRTISTGKKKKK